MSGVRVPPRELDRRERLARQHVESERPVAVAAGRLRCALSLDVSRKGSGATSRPNATWPPCYVTARRGAPDSQCGCAAYQPLAIRAVLGSVDNGSPPRCRVDVEGAIVCPISTTVHVERNPGFVHSRGPATYSLRTCDAPAALRTGGRRTSSRYLRRPLPSLSSLSLYISNETARPFFSSNS